MTEDDHRLQEASERLQAAITDTIVDMSRGPVDPTSITSREERITKAFKGMVTIRVYDSPGSTNSRLSDEEVGSIYTNMNGLLETLTEEEIEIARDRADWMLGIG